MHRGQAMGVVLAFVSVLGIAIYGYLLFLTAYDILLMKLTAFIAVSGVLGILAWIGYVLATTPLPKPIKEIEKKFALVADVHDASLINHISAL